MISELNPAGIKDGHMREIVTSIYEDLRDEPFLNGEFKFFSITFPAAIDHYRPQHAFRFKPRHVIQLYVSDDAEVIWDYDLFTTEVLDVTVSAACTVEAFIGRYASRQRL